MDERRRMKDDNDMLLMMRNYVLMSCLYVVGYAGVGRGGRVGGVDDQILDDGEDVDVEGGSG